MINGYEWLTWVFSGVGVFVISLVINSIIKKDKNIQSTSGNNAPIINGTRNNVEINNITKTKY